MDDRQHHDAIRIYASWGPILGKCEKKQFRNRFAAEGKAMKSYKVKDLMVSLKGYITVKDDATLYEAVMAIENALADSSGAKYPHRAVLVLDAGGKVVGKISQMDVLRALEPKYDLISHRQDAHLGGFTREFMKGMVRNFGLWDNPMKDICKKAAVRKVKDFMHTPGEGELVDAEDSLDEAIHQLLMGHHQSLLVLQGKEIVGILKLTDVYSAISQTIKECPV
jgi:CBS-domain-containing membrane protein